MSDFNIFIIQTGIGKARTVIFEKHLVRLGAKVCTSLRDDVTHVIVDDDLDTCKIYKLLKTDKNERLKHNFKIVKSKWLSVCIDKNEFINSHDFEIKLQTELYSTKSSDFCLNTNPSKSSFARRQFKEVPNIYFEPEKKKSKWVCMKSSNCVEINKNKDVTDELEKLMRLYENMNDKWRALSYRKAITSLKNHPTQITCYEEAIHLHGVGSQLAEKICEIIDSGKLRKLSELNEQESLKSLEIFTRIWGAGPQTAKMWVNQGFKTLQDLKEKANLTRLQEIGLKYYDELNDKMNRLEAKEIGDYVRKTATCLRSGCEVVVCGSFRRGRDLCGDVDVLISHKDGVSHAGLFDALVQELKTSEFITDQLVISNSGEQQKYLGVCKLFDENSMHRRIDIIIVPYHEYFPALLYFTGSGHFNRSMRNLASKIGMALNEHGLFKGVIRNKGVKVGPGIKLVTPTEESIFEHLDMPYRNPEERDF